MDNLNVLNENGSTNIKPVKHAGGRPTKFFPEFIILAFEFLALGYSKEALAGKIGINKDTLYAWSERYKKFSDAIKDGEAAGQLYWERMGITGANGEIEGFNSVAWLFNMKNRYKWTDKIDMDHTTHGKEISGFVVTQVKADE